VSTEQSLEALTPDDVARAQRRTLRVLFGSQVLGGVGVGIGIAVGSLLTEQMSGSATLAGLPQTSSVLGGALAALPLARLMGRHGRRPGLAAGYGVGALGALIVVLATVTESLALVLLGMALFGASSATNLQARYAATDLALPDHRARALSAVVWATTVGAVAGPNLMSPAANAAEDAGLPRYAGPFGWSVVAFALAMALLLVALRPDPMRVAQAQHRAGGIEMRRAGVLESFSAVLGAPRAALGLASIAVSHTVMVAVMVMTPVHMHDGGMDALNLIGLVISVHVAGMYALSPAVGWLSDRLGRVPVTATGWVVLLAATALAGTAGPRSSVQLSVGLFLLGLGWSFALVSGSTLLSESVPGEVRTGVQGAADLVMGLCGAGGGALAGVVVGSAGYGVLNLMAAALVLVVAVTAISTRARFISIGASRSS
jgi:MFS family permease